MRVGARAVPIHRKVNRARRLALLAAAFTVVAAASPLFAASVTPAAIGVGPNGYDFLIGTWSCRNSAPSTMEGPSQTTVTIARSAGGTLSVHVAAENFDAMGYIVYAIESKTWWNPSMLADGGYGTESSRQTGRRTVWTGSFTDPPAGKPVQVRDTYTFLNATTYTDLYQAYVNGTWKTEGNSTCRKV